MAAVIFERPNTMPIIHIVMFRFKPDIETPVINDVCKRMVELKENCLHPVSQKPYIEVSSGGIDNSPEGIQVCGGQKPWSYDQFAAPNWEIGDWANRHPSIQNGMTHAFVVQFANAPDRDYYVRIDPAHQEFVKSLGGIIEKAQAIDYTPGVF